MSIYDKEKKEILEFMRSFPIEAIEQAIIEQIAEFFIIDEIDAKHFLEKINKEMR